MTEISVRPIQPEEQPAARQLILAGLAEHWGGIDPMKNPDLKNILSTYSQGVFLTAWKGNELVGTGGLIPRGSMTAEIVRMSVAASCRRQGIGRLILDELTQAARVRGFQQVILETTATWSKVIEFYLRCGFKVTHEKDGDVYFSKTI